MSTDLKDKRRRIHNHACDECRRRKVRCEPSTPEGACENCLGLGIDCTRRKPHQKRGPKLGPDPARAFALYSVKKLVEDITKGTVSELYDLLGDNSTIWKVLTKLATRIQILEESTAYCQREHNHILSEGPLFHDGKNATDAKKSPADNENEAEYQVEELSKDFHQITFGLPQKVHFGETSNLQLVKTAVAHRKKVESNLPDWNELLMSIKRPVFWHTDMLLPVSQEIESNFEFPDDDYLLRLVDGYFTGSNLYCPLLQRPTFEQSLSAGLHLRDHSFGALVLVVCANGSLFINEEYLPAKSNTVKSGLKWFQQIPITQLSLNHSLSLHQLQLLCLSVIYLNIVSGTDRGWALCGIAIRLCQARGAHRRTVRDQNSALEQELWKRVFWTLIFLDTKMSMLYGRPRGTSAQEFDLEPLIELEGEHLEENISTRESQSPLPERLSKIAFWNCFLKLVEILGQAQESLYSVRKSELGAKMGIYSNDWDEKAVMELDSALNEWIASVPNHLKWESQPQNDLFFHQSAVIHSMYYWVQIQIHRRFIPRPGQTSEGKFPSLAICMNAARSCVRVIETSTRRKFLPYGHYMTPLFGSAMVLAVNLWRGRQTNPNFSPHVELADISKCVNLLRLYESRYILSGRLNDIINTVISAGHFELPTRCASGQNMVNPVPSENFSAEEQPYSMLPLLTCELGNIPVHLPTFFGYDYQVTSEELSIFDGANTNPQTPDVFYEPHSGENSYSADWDVLMEGMNGLLPTSHA